MGAGFWGAKIILATRLAVCMVRIGCRRPQMQIKQTTNWPRIYGNEVCSAFLTSTPWVRGFIVPK